MRRIIVTSLLTLVCAIMLGQTIFSTGGFLLAGQPLKTAMQCSFSLTQIGEFAFILAALGTSLGVTSNFLYPIVVAVSVFTTFTTPYMIRLAVPAYNMLYGHLPVKWKLLLDRYATGAPTVVSQENHWRNYLLQTGKTVLIYGVLCIAVITVMINFVWPLIESFLPQPWSNFLVAGLTLLCLAPFLRALMLKKSHSDVFQSLWTDSHFNRAPLIGVQALRIALGIVVVGYVIAHTLHWGGALGILVIVAVIVAVIMSRALKRQSIRLEQTFTDNLNQREREASQRAGRPQFAGRLVERDIHLSDFLVPVGIPWAGQTLAKLNLGRRFGVHVASVLRGTQRLNIPSGNTAILPGDRLQVIGTDQQLASFAHELEAQTALAQEQTSDNKDEMKLRRIVIVAGSRFVGQTIQQSSIRQDYRCLIVGLENDEDNGSLMAPNPQRPFAAGDVIWVVGEEADLADLEKDSHTQHPYA